METKDYLKDISEIKDMMSRSSQFISLSGLSGVMAGLYAIGGAFFARHLLGKYPVGIAPGYEPPGISYSGEQSSVIAAFCVLAVAIVLLSVITGLILNNRKAKKHGEPLWNSAAKRLVINFMIPLSTGGIFALLLLKNHTYYLIVPAMLIFYGLACVNASKNTFRDVRYFGLTMIILGLIAAELHKYALEIWTFGFGVCHLFYGLVMYFKYDRK